MKVLESKFKLKFNNYSLNFNNAVEGIQPFIVSELVQSDKNIILVLNDNKSISIFEKTIKAIKPNLNVKIFPSWDCFPYSDLSPSSQNINTRFEVLTESILNKKNYNLIITSYKNLIMRLPQKEEIKKNLFHLVKGKIYDMNNIINDVTNKGYNHVNLVLEPNGTSV